MPQYLLRIPNQKSSRPLFPLLPWIERHSLRILRMGDKPTALQTIRDAFGANAYRDDAYLQGNTEGTEAYEEKGPFRGKTDWQKLNAAFLDAHAAALSFFSEAGFRFFLPAYLVADLPSGHDRGKPVLRRKRRQVRAVLGVTVPPSLLTTTRATGSPSSPGKKPRLSSLILSVSAIPTCIARTGGKSPPPLTRFGANTLTTAAMAADLTDHLNEKTAFVAALCEPSGSN